MNEHYIAWFCCFFHWKNKVLIYHVIMMSCNTMPPGTNAGEICVVKEHRGWHTWSPYLIYGIPTVPLSSIYVISVKQNFFVHQLCCWCHVVLRVVQQLRHHTPSSHVCSEKLSGGAWGMLELCVTVSQCGDPELFSEALQVVAGPWLVHRAVRWLSNLPRLPMGEQLCMWPIESTTPDGGWSYGKGPLSLWKGLRLCCSQGPNVKASMLIHTPPPNWNKHWNNVDLISL